MNDNSPLEIKDTTRTPRRSGCSVFGMTTVLLNIHNAGIYEMSSMILAMGIFYGGLGAAHCGRYGVEEEEHVRARLPLPRTARSGSRSLRSS